MAAERNATNAAAERSVALDVPTGLRVYDEGGRRGGEGFPWPSAPSPGAHPVLQLTL